MAIEHLSLKNLFKFYANLRRVNDRDEGREGGKEDGMEGGVGTEGEGRRPS